MTQREVINQQNAQRVMDSIRAAQAQRKQNKEDDEVMSMVHAHHLEVLKAERMAIVKPEPAIPAVCDAEFTPVTVRNRKPFNSWGSVIAGSLGLVMAVVCVGVL